MFSETNDSVFNDLQEIQNRMVTKSHILLFEANRFTLQ